MVYLGHFSFENHDTVIPAESLLQSPSSWRGFFSCMAEAESVERALNKFEILLHRLARTSTVLSDVDEVYLDSCIEIQSIPKNGFMAYYKEMCGNQSLSTSLVGVKSNHRLAVYELTGHRCADNGEHFVAEPFLVFGK